MLVCENPYSEGSRLFVIADYGLHLSREFILGRLRGPRWFAWFTGVVLLWFVFACGISGYWLVWDKLAQFVAIATTEWLDALPLFGEPASPAISWTMRP